MQTTDRESWIQSNTKQLDLESKRISRAIYKNTIKEKIESPVVFFLKIIVVVVFFYAANYFIPVIFHWDNETRGTFGDQFGAINALFAGLAFAGMVYTLYLQRKDTEMQELEVLKSRHEMRLQNTQFALQNIALRRDRFEDSLYKMFNFHNSIVDSLIVANDGQQLSPLSIVHRRMKGVEIIRGRETLDVMLLGTENAKGVVEIIREGGMKAYDQSFTHDVLDHYFRHITLMLQSIDQAEELVALKVSKKRDSITPDEEATFAQRCHFTSLVRAMLSRYELALLYCHGLSTSGRKQLKPLFEKYGMFSDIDLTLVYEDITHLGESRKQAGSNVAYSESAFIDPLAPKTTA